MFSAPLSSNNSACAHTGQHTNEEKVESLKQTAMRWRSGMGVVHIVAAVIGGELQGAGTEKIRRDEKEGQ